MPVQNPFFKPPVRRHRWAVVSASFALFIASVAGAQVNVPSAATAPTIDGTAEAAWNAAAATSVNNVSGVVDSTADLSATWRALWDATNLYVLVQVTDNSKVNDSTDPWQDDCVEIMIDGGNNKTTAYDANDRQYIFAYGDAAAIEAGGRTVTGVTFAKADPTTTSYTIEVRIPWSAIGATRSAGQNIGIDVHVDDDDAGGNRQGKRMWTDTTDTAWTNPSVFGTATLQAAATPPPPPPPPSGGSISREVWTGITGNAVSLIPTGTTPSSTGTLTSFEAPTNTAESYGQRVRGYLTAPTTGSYTFWIASDDDSQLWIGTNDQASTRTQIASVTGWTNSREWGKFTTQKSAARSLTAGVRYYIEALHKEGNGGDNLAVGWARPGQGTTSPSEVIPGSVLSPFGGTTPPPPPPPPPAGGDGLNARYYNNMTVSGTAALTRTDPTVDFAWTGSPGTGVNADAFSVRWMGELNPPTTGAYTFEVVSDDGVRLWVNDALLVNQWIDQGPTAYQSGTVNLTAGTRVDVNVDFYENGGGAEARLRWRTPGGSTFVTIPQANLFSTGGDNPPPISTPPPPPPPTTPPPPPPPPSSTTNYFGLNTWFLQDWSGSREFADAIKEARPFEKLAGGNANLDANEWPTEDFRVCTWHGIGRMNGTYQLSWTGQAGISGEWAPHTISPVSYNSSTNTSTCSVTYNATDGAGFKLTFTNTKRTAASATNTGITNLRMMKPTTEGGSTSYATNVLYTNQLKNVMGKGKVIRFMDWLATNGNQVGTWSQRTRPAHARQTRQHNGRDAGICWEYAVQLCNELDQDMWLNIPVFADDAYVTNVARLLRYGSDGTNPYTSAQASPVFPPLEAGRLIYVEYSNELWNTAGGFEQSHQNADLAEATPSPMNYDGATSRWTLAWRRIAARSVQVSNLFRAVWGDAAMNNTVRVTLNAQLGYADGPQLESFRLMEEYYANPDRVATPRRANYYFYGYGGSAYMDASDTSTVDQIFATMPANIASYEREVDWAIGWGLKRVAYEGGPSLPNTAVGNAAWSDARMRTEVVDNHNGLWTGKGGDLLVYYVAVAGSPEWSFTRDAFDTNTPKLNALGDLYNANRAAVTYGTVLPATITASNYQRPPTWMHGQPSDMSGRKYFTYTVRATTARNYTITANTTSSAGGNLEIIVDGTSQGTVAVPAGTGQTTAGKTVNLGVGIHGIMIKHSSGAFGVNSIGVQ